LLFKIVYNYIEDKFFMLDQDFIQAMKLRLTAERAEVEEEIKQASQPELEMDNPDEDDLANDAVEDILQGSSIAVLRGLLDKIDRALERVANSTYGICLETGQEIPPAVLANEPWAEIIPPIMRQKMSQE
jgi:RNA polymerase-binding transcription factor DksA